uniref:PLAT domain-containing protein n=1 Tax=Branchiostoma floridae TaxID=7739 RepID=C3YSN7_BRAFL|eukprot:XP_002600726.1 hypothetical protein BRAFLDRAFT_83468 [Branchiostoma floridae]
MLKPSNISNSPTKADKAPKRTRRTIPHHNILTQIENTVVLQNLKTGLLQEFPVYRWLSRRRDDYRIAREVAMMGSGDGQVRIYKVRVTTADKWGAATTSPVIVCLHGSQRQSGRVQVMGELDRGRETEFTIAAPHVGDLQSVELNLDGNGHWALEKANSTWWYDH